MKTGIIMNAGALGNDPSVIRDFAQMAEELGYSHLLDPEHVLLHDAEYHGVELELGLTHEAPFHEPFALFGFIAGVTQQIKLITGILVLPQRQTPLVAKQAAQVDLLSKGRLILGVGVGWNSVEFEALGADFHHRGQRIEEQVHLLRELWSKPLVTFEGQFERLDHVGINPRPERQIPIWIGGTVDAVIDRAARIGDGLVVFRFASRDDLAQKLEKLWQRVEAAGRQRSEVGTHIGLVVTPDNIGRMAQRLDAYAELGVEYAGLIISGAEQIGLAGYMGAFRTFAQEAGL